MTSTPQEQTNEASPPPSEEPVGGTKASAPPTTCARPPYYSRHKLLFLTKSPLVSPPSDMPPLKDWFGDWNEQQPARKDVDSNGTARTRYRNHADDSEQPPRESTSRPTRPTFSQATQMGNFRHQSIKLDLHDRDNSLRSLSDKFDRDRTLRSGDGLGSGTSSNTLSLPQSSRRDAGPHLSGRQSTTSLSSTGTSATRKTNNDRDRDSSYRGEANGRRGANGPEGRGERSDDWRRGGLKDDWETRDRDRPNERERTRDRDRRSRSRDPKRDDRRDKDDARKDSDHSGWTVATGDRDRRRNARERDRDRDEEEGTGRERTGRRAADREREKEKEPAWMEDYVPDSTSKSSGKGFGLLAAEGGLDGLQAWKKEMMEKEKERDSQKEKPIMNPLVNDLAPPETSPTNGLNDIEKFKLAMKESQAQKEKALGKSPTDTVVVADGPPPGLQPVADQSSVKADPAIIQSQLPADPAIINSSTPVPSLPTTTAVSTAIIGNEGPTVGSISLKSLGLAPADDVATPSRMAHPPNDTSQDAAFAFKNLIMPSSTPPIQPVSPNHARTGSTDPTRLLSNPVTPLPNSPSTVDTRSSSRNALGRDSLGEFGKPLNSAAIFEASAVVNPPPTASAMGRSKFAKFFQSQDRDSAAGVNPRTPTNSISGPNPSLPVHNHDPLLSLAGNGPIGGQPLMNPSPSNLSMVDSVNGQNILNPLAQGPNALSGLLANLNMNGAASVNKGVDRNQAVGVPTGGSIEGIFAALAASKPSGNRPPSGAGFGQAPKIPQSQSPHHFGTQHQLHPQQLQMPHIPPPNTQLPFNPSSQNDLTDGGKFVPNGMVPGLGPPRRDSTISGGSDLDERDRYGFNLQRLPPQAQQQLFEQQQLNQLRSVPQPMYPNQGPNRNGMNVMPPQFRHGPSPIGNQNPTSNGSQHQRGMSSMGGIIRPNPQELVGNGGGAGMVGMGLPVMRGMGSGIGPDVIRGPHELGLRGGPQDLNGIPGIMRSPSDVPGPFGMAQQQFGGPQQLPGQQNSLPPNHILTGPTAGGPVRVGPPGSADFVLHTQQLQAARAAAAAQQQQQMMQHLGLGLRHPNPQSVQQPQQLRPGLPQHILPHNVNQQQQLGGLNQVGISQLHPNDFGGSGFPPHANHVGGIGPNAPGAGAEAFLQLFMNGSGQRE